MLFVLVPMIPFACAVFLLSMEPGKALVRAKNAVVTISGLLFLGLSFAIAKQISVSNAQEFYFSPLFKMPGSAESLSFSLYIDKLSVTWLLYLAIISLVINVTGTLFESEFKMKNHHLAANQMGQAGLATFFLAGSLVTSLVGWGIALAAITLANTDRKRSKNDNQHMAFMILMLSVFLLPVCIYLLYGLTGKLAFSNNTTHMAIFLRNAIVRQPGSLIYFTVNVTGLLIILSIMPGLGIAPFTPWLDDTRGGNTITNLYAFLITMPAGIVVLQRYHWLFQLTPGIKITFLCLALLSFVLACLACFGQKGGTLTMPWLAVAGTSLLAISIISESATLPTIVFLTVYPGFLVFSLGRLVTIDLNHISGKTIQITGICIIFASVLIAFIISGNSFIFFATAFLLPLFLVFRHSHSPEADTSAFPAPIGWHAFSFFGMTRLLKLAVVWPVIQISDGFWTLESLHNQFWQFGLGRALKSCSHYLRLFDVWIIDGSFKLFMPGNSKRKQAERIKKL